MKKLVVGIFAHVDAGKTTLSEAMLYETGQIRTLGRVDHKNAFLDHTAMERERGITIFSKQARIQTEHLEITLLDTPGHVDFSAEMERTLLVLDYAVLVISGTDGVQAHTKTLWRLLKHYNIPVFVFINKMDLAGANRETVQRQLIQELSDGCVDFSGSKTETAGKASDQTAEWLDALAMCSEELMNCFLEKGDIPSFAIGKAIAERKVFPCFYGAALKLHGVKELLAGLEEYGNEPLYKKEFAARVYKIGRDPRGNRLTYLKITGGMLRIKERIHIGDAEEKVDQIRFYSGEKYELREDAQAGDICAVTGLLHTLPGQGLGTEQGQEQPLLEPVLTYQILLPKEASPLDMLGKLRMLEEEEPQLHIVWQEEHQEIHAKLMGRVQIEVFTRLIEERFGVKVSFGAGKIVYRETIAKPVEGVGHFEPLRHYAEVHLLIEPGEAGSGIQIQSACSEDVLDLNWQRLILTHIGEREHPGVLTGSALSDVKITLLTGRAHLKHTEGGDFRQAVYRAIRQGLMKAESVLLEPVYAFTLEVPADCAGRAMNDIRQRHGNVGPLEYGTGPSQETAVLKGTVPVASLGDYMEEVNSYTKGAGNLILTLKGYDVCHNTQEVLDELSYHPEADTANPAGSVFCAHGAGFYVPWNEVEQYMHLPLAYTDENRKEITDGYHYDSEGSTICAAGRIRPAETKKLSAWELDQELMSIYAREFGMDQNAVEEQERKKWLKKASAESKPRTVKYDKKGNPIYPAKGPQEEYLFVDGYNVIFAWEDLKELSAQNIDAARDKLLDELSNYQGYKQCHIEVVFDAYKRKGNPGSKSRYQNLKVVYTKAGETADAYIERAVHELRDKYKIIVATSDGLEQLTVLGQGALRMSAKSLKEEIRRTAREGYEKFSAYY